jgi:hypothetical protein
VIAPRDADGPTHESVPERLGSTDAFAAELERLAAVAPEPWATKLRAILAEELAR